MAIFLDHSFPTYEPRTRTYYIAAEKTIWDYAPTAKDGMTSGPVPGPWGEQTTYDKVRYIEYTDSTFKTKKKQPAWLGILGPVIRGVTGDTIKVEFYNRADKPYSIHPHGVRYDKNNEGASHEMFGMDMGPVIDGSRVAPGKKYTYTWHVLETASPTRAEGGSKIWMYHSHVDSIQDIYDGLIGPIIITSPAYARDDATPRDVDREFVTMFMVFDESKPDMDDEQVEMSLKHSINGYIFSNLPGLDMKKNDKVRWHLIGMGNEVDLHTPHWHGEVVQTTTGYTDVLELLPATMKSVYLIADNPGKWMFHCHVFDHIKAGMTALYRIKEL